MTKWTEDRTEQLRNLAGNEGDEVSREQVAEIAEQMDISGRSVSSKLRKEGYTVQKVTATPSSFSEEETEQLRSILEQNDGEFTYAELAEQLGSSHTAKAVQGKVLSMEMTSAVRRTPPKEVERVYNEEQTATIIEMANSGAWLEEIAEAVDMPVNSVRGKALSLHRADEISKLPKQRDRKEAAKDAFSELGDSISEMTVDQIVEATGKTVRGVKTMLTRRQLTAADYDGAARARKTAEKAA
jgi:DNA-binding transcriptional ArsR family regulator